MPCDVDLVTSEVTSEVTSGSPRGQCAVTGGLLFPSLGPGAPKGAVLGSPEGKWCPFKKWNEGRGPRQNQVLPVTLIWHHK